MTHVADGQPPAREHSLRALLPVIKFLVVGGLSTVTTVGVFNLLAHVGNPPLLEDHPVTAYLVGMVLGLALNYVGNRFWAFGTARTTSLARHLVAFLVANGVALAIPVVCLGFSRYVLGLDSVVADNVAANVVGLVLATVARWWLYRTFVFRVRH